PPPVISPTLPSTRPAMMGLLAIKLELDRAYDGLTGLIQTRSREQVTSANRPPSPRRAHPATCDHGILDIPESGVGACSTYPIRGLCGGCPSARVGWLDDQDLFPGHRLRCPLGTGGCNLDCWRRQGIAGQLFPIFFFAKSE